MIITSQLFKYGTTRAAMLNQQTPYNLNSIGCLQTTKYVRLEPGTNKNMNLNASAFMHLPCRVFTDRQTDRQMDRRTYRKDYDITLTADAGGNNKIDLSVRPGHHNNAYTSCVISHWCCDDILLAMQTDPVTYFTQILHLKQKVIMWVNA